MDNKERFLTLMRSVNRDGINDLIDWLEKSDFFTCPASTRYHSAFEGGLLQHSLNVYDQSKRLALAFPEILFSEESLIITSLLHDICKVNFYGVEKRNRKNEFGVWESYNSYTVNEKFCFGGHGAKSVFIVQNFIKLSPEEAVAINCHMGMSENEHVGNSYEQYPLAWIIHVADEAATFLNEKSNNT